MSDDTPQDVAVKESQSKSIPFVLLGIIVLLVCALVLLLVQLAGRSDRAQELAGMVSGYRQQVVVLQGENDDLRRSSAWRMSYDDAASLAERASEGLETLIAGLDMSIDDKRTVLMGSFCGAWVDWRRLSVEDYSADKPYPLLQYRDTAQRLYGELAEQDGGHPMSFDTALEKSCLVI